MFLHQCVPGRKRCVPRLGVGLGVPTLMCLHKKDQCVLLSMCTDTDVSPHQCVPVRKTDESPGLGLEWDVLTLMCLYKKDWCVPTSVSPHRCVPLRNTIEFPRLRLGYLWVCENLVCKYQSVHTTVLRHIVVGTYQFGDILVHGHINIGAYRSRDILVWGPISVYPLETTWERLCH